MGVSLFLLLMLLTDVSQSRKMFIKSNSGLTWESGKQFCQDQGGQLVNIKSDSIQNKLDAKLNRDWTFLTEFWFGLHYKNDNKWYWSDGGVANLGIFSAWNPSEPDNLFTDKCVRGYKHPTGFEWRTMLCQREYDVICEVDRITTSQAQTTLFPTTVPTTVADTSTEFTTGMETTSATANTLKTTSGDATTLLGISSTKVTQTVSESSKNSPSFPTLRGTTFSADQSVTAGFISAIMQNVTALSGNLNSTNDNTKITLSPSERSTSEDILLETTSNFTTSSGATWSSTEEPSNMVVKKAIGKLNLVDPDSRPTAVALGVSGIIFVCVFLCVMAAADFTRIRQDLRQMYRDVRSRFCL